MKFIDEAEVHVRAGDGGRGCVSFLREKYKPHGGPNGGDGGDGGNVVFVVDPGLTTLLDFKFQPRVQAGRGEHGRGKEQYGKRGEDRLVRVPPGTLVTDVETGEQIADLRIPHERCIVAHGGRGGRGNAHFATPTNQAPRYAQPGTPGEDKRLRLELHLMADVGLVGYPNAGKSTLIAAVSAARPRIADYPFTTLVPHLGVVRFDEDSSFVLADIPGLIEGAHRGRGLGDRFLRHVSRTTLLIHLLDISGLSGRDPMADFDAINAELRAFDAALATKPQIVVANKLDLQEARERYPELRTRFAQRGIALWGISAATREGVAALMREAGRRWQALRKESAAGTAPPIADPASLSGEALREERE
ncbi:MAG: Obg family GTPase CgtA [Deltaproteobacteria bacterium]|nr:Obg family GTPase CgtA [Deltaproteobacteria bacterium]